jgi:hypothetical protein
MFFFRKNKLVVEAFTKVQPLADIGIPRASQFIPEWWKNLPKTIYGPNENGMAVPRQTMRSCAGFIDLYNRGHILPMWSDVLLEINETSYTWQFADHNAPGIVEHGKHQYTTEEYKFDHYRHAKLEAPWLVRCNKDVKFLAIEPTYNNLVNDYGIKYLPGVVDFKYQHGINVNLLLPAQIRRIKINHLDPLYHWICLEDDYNVEFKSIVVDSLEYEKLERASNFRPHFTGSFLKARKCPFNNK